MRAETSANERDLLNEIDAARFLGVSARTLQAWRVHGGGPRYSKLGRSVRYRQCDLDAFVEKNLTNSTSEAAGK